MNVCLAVSLCALSMAAIAWAAAFAVSSVTRKLFSSSVRQPELAGSMRMTTIALIGMLELPVIVSLGLSAWLCWLIIGTAA